MSYAQVSPSRFDTRPVPHRVLSYQHQSPLRELSGLNTFAQTPPAALSQQTSYCSSYPSPTSPFSPSSPKTSTYNGLKPKRPGPPSRSHSFCGDGSATTYALASVKAGSFLSPDKTTLVASKLERTISSFGNSHTSRASNELPLFPSCSQMVRPPLTQSFDFAHGSFRLRL